MGLRGILESNQLVMYLGSFTLVMQSFLEPADIFFLDLEEQSLLWSRRYSRLRIVRSSRPLKIISHLVFLFLLFPNRKFATVGPGVSAI